MIFAYWINRTWCARASETHCSERSMRNESLYVPSRVNRDKLFFMFLSHIKRDLSRFFASHNKVMKSKKVLKCTHQAAKPQDNRSKSFSLFSSRAFRHGLLKEKSFQIACNNFLIMLAYQNF